MTMQPGRLPTLWLAVVVFGGCTQPMPLYPVRTLRSLAATADCPRSEVEVRSLSLPFNDDPFTKEHGFYRVRACGRTATYRCPASGSLGGRCTPTQPYQTAEAPNRATVRIFNTALHDELPTRENLLLGADGWVVRRAGRGERLYAVSPVPGAWRINAVQFVTDVHSRASPEQISVATRLRAVHWCDLQFDFQPEAGGVYWLAYTYETRGDRVLCGLNCIRRDGGESRACANFHPRPATEPSLDAYDGRWVPEAARRPGFSNPADPFIE